MNFFKKRTRCKQTLTKGGHTLSMGLTSKGILKFIIQWWKKVFNTSCICDVLYCRRESIFSLQIFSLHFPFSAVTNIYPHAACALCTDVPLQHIQSTRTTHFLFCLINENQQINFLLVVCLGCIQHYWNTQQIILQIFNVKNWN